MGDHCRADNALSHTPLQLFSNIDGTRIFPERRLTPTPHPFRFRDQLKPEIAEIPVRAGVHVAIPLSSALLNSGTTAYLGIEGDLVLFEQYDYGYNRETPSLPFPMATSVLSHGGMRA